ncbi:TPA: type VI secretion system lipoprotein TssJ [Salmonella enterica]|nr:type VI secretion system lipoprotein TssJ [Salmonella enterica subsp. indica serovar 11:b:e,n,x]HBC0142891.1 type VI secretion system lipoprotein TssJ [Salmonella enterica subsp. indica serovar 11:b:e,n,x]HBC0164846.1 type VI secretion system lipoprotein TssJ [Salmonella enterica subsp. indica]HCL5298575.1 type VI secretion system lipoprotein TssJ [Salmonella enterica]
MTGRFFRVWLAVVLLATALTGCETAKKISQVIRNPDIQVGKLADQSSEVTVTLLTEPDSNLTADGEAAPVDVQLVYLSDDSKFLAADYDQIATTALPDALGKNYIDHQDFNLLPDIWIRCRKAIPATSFTDSFSARSYWRRPEWFSSRSSNTGCSSERD